MMAGIGNPPYNDRDLDIVRKRGLAPLNPYLSIDPTYLQQAAPEYIFPEGASRQRGRLELAFSQIGASCMTGAAFGGVGGLYNGFKMTTLAGQTGKLRRTQMLNHIVKQGSANANTLGVIAVMYSTFGVALQWTRGADDELNTMAAATATGLLYKSAAGLPKCLMGGAVGFGLGLVACLWTSRDRLEEYKRHLSLS